MKRKSKPQSQTDPINPDAVAQSGSVSRHQSFVCQTLHRRELKKAEYNPRVLSDKARVKLKASLERVGLVQPIVWNKRTGNIVGGHQRIKTLDKLEGTDDYSLDVAVLDVDEAREKEINILLNNQTVGGDYDLAKLQDLLAGEIDLLNTGFDQTDYVKMFGTWDGAPQTVAAKEIAEDLDGVSDAYDRMCSQNDKRNDRDFYNVLVFEDYTTRKAFLDALGFDDNRYVDGRILLDVIRDLKLASKQESLRRPASGGLPEKAELSPAGSEG